MKCQHGYEIVDEKEEFERTLGIFDISWCPCCGRSFGTLGGHNHGCVTYLDMFKGWIIKDERR